MKKIKKYFSILFLFIAGSSIVQAQPFSEDIAAFKKMDSTAFPAQNQILFIGSSSFTYWQDVQDYFPSKQILNRAFGGSTLPDLIRYRYDVIYPYQPKQIVIYCGENDFAASDTVSVETVVNRFEALFTLIRSRYKTIPVAYVSMKPSPNRVQLMPKFEQANRLIKNFLSKKSKTIFIDVYHAMLNTDGTPMTDIFLEDQLHMNAKGYAIWKKIIQPVLVK